MKHDFLTVVVKNSKVNMEYYPAGKERRVVPDIVVVNSSQAPSVTRPSSVPLPEPVYDVPPVPPHRTYTPHRVEFCTGNGTTVRVEPLRDYTYGNNGNNQMLQKKSSSLRSRRDVEELEEAEPCQEPVDGCLVLGGRQGPSFASYVTRYRVDRDEQREGVLKREALETCLPCYTGSARESLLNFILTCLLSEAFLYVTQFFVFALGTTRVLHINRGTHKLAHDIVSSTELVLATIHLVARYGIVRRAFNKLRTDITSLQHVEEGLSARGADLRNWMWTYAVLSFVAMVFNIIIFAIFHVTFLHQWTFLINNLLIMTFASSSRVFTANMSNLSQWICMDHLRITLFEATLLLREGFLVSKSSQRKTYKERVDCFLNAFRITKNFRKPSYIHLLNQYAPDWEKNSLGTDPITTC